MTNMAYTVTIHSATSIHSSTSVQSYSERVDQTALDCAAALFAYELEDLGVSDETVRAIHTGHHDEWLEALEYSGLFTHAELAAMAARWNEHPGELLEMLLRDVDEVTRRRCNGTWTSLGRRTLVG